MSIRTSFCFFAFVVIRCRISPLSFSNYEYDEFLEDQRRERPAGVNKATVMRVPWNICLPVCYPKM